ncbi:kynurenine-oxoglutarate transaminase [Thraustotheca clavata]|uniref:Kynurenine-oxoglutarate transaminase n=1 Tax=Thraustotheca clavata TaxID=74557 RepID=A0A1V9ZX73_9STRA|nr:kynurenine-oxoglutarate transaminase [Thraustotheca clavata]
MPKFSLRSLFKWRRTSSKKSIVTSPIKPIYETPESTPASSPQNSISDEIQVEEDTINKKIPVPVKIPMAYYFTSKTFVGGKKVAFTRLHYKQNRRRLIIYELDNVSSYPHIATFAHSGMIRFARQRVAVRAFSAAAETSVANNIGKNVFAEFSALAAKHGALNLGQGFPSFGTPGFLKDAAIQAIQAEHNQYTRPGGNPALVQVLAELYSPIYGRQLNPMTEIVTFTGAQEGIFCIFLSLLSKGDEVLILEPYFDAYINIAKLLGIKTVGLPLELSAEKKAKYNDPSCKESFSSKDLVLDLEKLEASITPNTKMIVLNTPHNPTGKVFSREELEGIAAIMRRHPQIIILSDEVYEFMCFEGTPHERIATFDGMYDRVISLFSAGKTFSCTGWRVGYAILPEHFALPVSKTHSAVPFCGALPFELAVAKGFQVAQNSGYLEELPQILQSKRDVVVDALTAANLKPIVPDGGYFVCCNVSTLDAYDEFRSFENQTDLENELRPDYQMAQKLCVEHGITVIPTSPFFTSIATQPSPAMVRIAYCKDDATIAKAVEIIKSF